MPVDGFFARFQLQRESIECAGSAGEFVGRLERSVEEGLNLGDFDEIVGDLETLDVADDTRHFLYPTVGQSSCRKELIVATDLISIEIDQFKVGVQR